MKYKIIFIIILLALYLMGLKISNSSYNHKLKSYSDSLQLYKKARQLYALDSMRVVKNVPPGDAMKLNTSTVPGSFDLPYLNASQGIEAHVKGIEWKGYFLDDPAILPKIKQFGGRYINTIDKIELDPDFPDSGYPNLSVSINGAPTLYTHNFQSDMLRKIFRKDSPIETYTLTTSNGNTAKMQLWLVQFDMTFRIEPSDNHSRNEEYVFDGTHPVTKENVRILRSRKEMDDQRYSDMHVLLEFKPKAGSWYIADQNSQGYYAIDDSPSIGIGAVECMHIEKIGEEGINNADKRIGVVLNKGKALSLYPSLELLKNTLNPDFVINNEILEDAGPDQVIKSTEGRPLTINSSLFNKSKFASIPIQNLGSWKEPKEWFLGKTKYNADYFHASFLVQLYVFGEWAVKPDAFAQFEAREPYSVEKQAFFDRIFPDFELGFFGEFISFAIISIALILVMSIFFPAILRLLNRILFFVMRKVLRFPV